MLLLALFHLVLVGPPLWPADNSGGDGNDDALVGCGDGGGSCSSDGGSRVNGGDDGGGSGGVALPAKAAILTWAVARCSSARFWRCWASANEWAAFSLCLGAA